MKIKWEIWNLVMDERKNLAFWYYVISAKTNYDKVLFTYSLLCCCRLCCTNQMSEKTRATTHARAEDGRETKTEKLWLRFALRRLWLREETKTEMKRQWRYDDVPIVGMSKRHKTLSSTLIVNRNKIEWTKWFNAKRRINRIKTNSASFIANWKLKTQERKWQREERIFSKENFSEHFFFTLINFAIQLFFVANYFRFDFKQQRFFDFLSLSFETVNKNEKPFVRLPLKSKPIIEM